MKIMGCIYSCQCGGICIGCSQYEPERYYGHAEDLAAQARGYKDYDDQLEQEKERRKNPDSLDDL